MRKLVIDKLIEVLGGENKILQTVTSFIDKKENYGYWEIFSKEDEIIKSLGTNILLSRNTITGLFYFIKNARTVLYPSEDLFISLVNTKFYNIKLSEVKMPYPSFYILFPQNAFSVSRYLNNGYKVIKDKFIVEGVIVTQAKVGSTEFFLIPQEDSKKTNEKFLGHHFWINFNNVKNKTFKEIIPELSKTFKESIVSPEDFFNDFLSILINFLLFYSLPKELAATVVDDEYISLINELLKKRSSKKINKLKRKLDKISPSKIEKITPRINIVWKLDKNKNETYNDSSIKNKMRLHIVSGHWKIVHTRKVTKLTHVQPYWRGNKEKGLTRKINIIK